MHLLTISWTPVMQYHKLVRTVCSSRVYHIAVLSPYELTNAGALHLIRTYMRMNAGCTQDSKMPSKKRTAINAPQFVAAAEHAITAPQRNMLLPNQLDSQGEGNEQRTLRQDTWPPAAFGGGSSSDTRRPRYPCTEWYQASCNHLL